eukprot:gene9194-10168_t
MDTELSLKYVDDLSSNDSGVTVVTSNSFVRNDEYCTDEKVAELKATIVDLQDVVRKYQEKLDTATRQEEKPKPCFVKNLVSENKKLKKLVEEYSSERVLKEDKRKLQIIESQQNEIEKLKNEIEVRDAKQLANLKDINDHLKMIIKIQDGEDERNVKDVINALVIKKSEDAQVEDDVFEEFLEFASLITSLDESSNDLKKVQQNCWNKEKQDLEDLVKFIELEHACTIEEVQALREENSNVKQENARLAEENSNLHNEMERLEGLVAYLKYDKESSIEEMQSKETLIASMEEEMASLKREMSLLSEENSTLEIEKNGMQEIVEFLQFAQDSTVKESNKEKLKVESMEEEIASLKKEMSRLSEDNSNMEKEKNGMQEIVEFLQFAQDSTVEELKKMKNKNAILDEEKTNLIDSKANLVLKSQVQENEIIKLKEIIEVIQRRRKTNWCKRLLCCINSN